MMNRTGGPTDTFRGGMTPDEIRALAARPELRRIFEEEPGSFRTAVTRRGAARREPGQGDLRGRGHGSRTRRGRVGRAALGLVPLFLALGIIGYETGIGAPMLLASLEPLDGAPVDARQVHAAMAAAPSVDRATTPGQTSDGREQPSAPPEVDSRQPTSASTTSASTKVAVANEAPLHGAASKASVELYKGGMATARSLASEEPSPDPEIAAAVESALELSRAERRELQRRLRLAEHDPKMIDGVFGPATREAIASWQAAVGLPATGYLDEVAVVLLKDRTAESYEAWRVAERARERAEEERSAVVSSSAPQNAAAHSSGDCLRLASGHVAYGQGVHCDAMGLRENFRRDFRALKSELRGLFQ